MKNFVFAIMALIVAAAAFIAVARPPVQPVGLAEILYEPANVQDKFVKTLILERSQREEDRINREIASLDSEIQKQLTCLATNIYFEARGESVEGRIAVGQVTLNRVNSSKFPNTVCGVVYQKTYNQKTEKTICQFSWHCDAEVRNKKMKPHVYNEIYELAYQLLIDGVRLASLENALFFHATTINPKWNLEKIETIGGHVFYRYATS